MKKVTLAGLSLICLFVLGACTAPEKTDANAEVNPDVKVEQKQESRKLERQERDFFDRGGMFK